MKLFHFGLFSSKCLTHIDGAAHEGASLQSFLHDLVELFGSLLHLVELSDSTGEILHGLGGVSTLQGLVGAVKPGRRGAQISFILSLCYFTLTLVLLSS